MTSSWEKKEMIWLTTTSCRLPLLFLLVVSFSFSTAVAQRGMSAHQRGARQPSTNDAGLTPAARSSLDAALAALETNSLSDAERAARAAVAAAPRSAVTHNVLGVVLDRAGHADEAFSEFSTAVKLDPNSVSARNNLGRMLADRGQTSAAIAQFENVLKSDPSHVQAHYNLATLYMDAGDFAKA